MLDRRTFAATALLASLPAEAGALASEINRRAAAIHQAVRFKPPPERIYAALTDPSLFDKIVHASAAMNSSMMGKLGSAPTAIDARPGGAFTLFGGYITGFNLVMEPGAHLVQAWRAASWGSGLFSIAAFVLSRQGTGTGIAFDHRGFPDDAAEHLAKGWHDNYWDPMKRVIA